MNCERAMAGHTRFGGHMVQGHVDSTATIISKQTDGNSIRYSFRFPADVAETFMPYLIEKGYVTVDGASLTLTHVSPLSAKPEESAFGIMLIAHSQEKLTLTRKEVGDTVNIEVDCVGKYVLRSVEGEGTGGLRGLVERLVDSRVNDKLRESGLTK